MSETNDTRSWRERADRAAARCSLHLESEAGQAFMDLLQARLEMHRDMVLDLSGERAARIQGAGQEIRELIKKLTRNKGQ